jgi:hypothetical protein
MLRKLCLLLIIQLFSGQILLKAQAYDGSIDRKLFLGYANVGGLSGAEFKYEAGYNDYFSGGINFAYLFNNADTIYADESEKATEFWYRCNAALFFNFHFLPNLSPSGKLDPYAGIYLSFKSIGIQAGLKYNFSERFGCYGQINQSVSNSVRSINTNPGDYSNYFGKKTYLSVGLTCNLN